MRWHPIGSITSQARPGQGGGVGVGEVVGASATPLSRLWAVYQDGGYWTGLDCIVQDKLVRINGRCHRARVSFAWSAETGGNSCEQKIAILKCKGMIAQVAARK